MDSKVFRPMITGCPSVFFLNQAKSAGRCQGNLLLMPITRFLAIATIRLTGMFKLQSAP